MGIVDNHLIDELLTVLIIALICAPFVHISTTIFYKIKKMRFIAKESKWISNISKNLIPIPKIEGEDQIGKIYYFDKVNITNESILMEKRNGNINPYNDMLNNFDEMVAPILEYAVPIALHEALRNSRTLSDMFPDNIINLTAYFIDPHLSFEIKCIYDFNLEPDNDDFFKYERKYIYSTQKYLSNVENAIDPITSEEAVMNE